MMRWSFRQRTEPSADALLEEFDDYVHQWERRRLEWSIERERMRLKTCSLVEVGCGLSEWYMQGRGEGR